MVSLGCAGRKATSARLLRKFLFMSCAMGYDVKNRKLVINDAEARIVVEIYQRYLALKSVHALRDALSDAGLRRILESPGGSRAAKPRWARDSHHLPHHSSAR
jgi:hypothetical protein